MAFTYTIENPSVKLRKRLKSWAVIFFTASILLVICSLSFWLFAPAPKRRTLVVDKTVPHPDYREHQALLWILNHTKAANQAGKRIWRPDKDYLGFYPEKFVASDSVYSSNLEHDHLVGIDLLFVVDTYGVYVDDYKSLEEYQTHQDYSKKIFGGLDEKEVDTIVDFVQKGGSLVAEFNTFNDPTHGKERERMEQLLGIHSTGWIGRYFADLSNSNDVPPWALRDWKMHHGEDWNFSGPGFIIAHPDTRLIVLEEGKDVESRGLWIEINASDDHLMKAIAPRVSYPYWFDIVFPEKKTEVLAEYRLRLTARGRQKTREFSIPEKFPAVLRASRSPMCVYFAGDFSDNNINTGPYFFCGWSHFRRILCFLGKNRAHDRFFWAFYLPLVSNIIKGDSDES